MIRVSANHYWVKMTSGVFILVVIRHPENKLYKLFLLLIMVR